MREERLLERIRAWEKDPSRRSREDPGKVTDSVIGYLQRILNTKQGNVPIAGDYGLPDFSDLVYAFPESIRDIEKAIRQAIQKYEPRLKTVRINYVQQEEDVLTLRFQIIAKLSSESKTQVLFETVIDSEGKVNIKG
jgi:type VI secretion system protein